MSEQGYGSLSIKPQVGSNQLESKGKENNLESQESDSKNKTEAPKPSGGMRKFANEGNEPYKVDLSNKSESKEIESKKTENDDEKGKEIESKLQQQDGQKEESNEKEQGQEVLSESEYTDSPLSLTEEIEETKESEESNKDKASASESTSAAETSDSNEQEEAKPELNIPEGANKLFKFMEETGGSVEDYVRLNMDVDSLDEQTLLKEYYKSANPHLDSEDIDFKLEELSYDEELDDDREVRRKKLQYKDTKVK